PPALARIVARRAARPLPAGEPLAAPAPPAGPRGARGSLAKPASSARPGVFLRAPKMAGAGGFEPPDARSKVSCLTAWPRPTNRTGFPSRSVRSHQRDPGVMATGLEETAMEKCSGRLARGNGEVKRRGTRRG